MKVRVHATLSIEDDACSRPQAPGYPTPVRMYIRVGSLHKPPNFCATRQPIFATGQPVPAIHALKSTPCSDQITCAEPCLSRHLAVALPHGRSRSSRCHTTPPQAAQLPAMKHANPVSGRQGRRTYGHAACCGRVEPVVDMHIVAHVQSTVELVVPSRRLFAWSGQHPGLVPYSPLSAFVRWRRQATGPRVTSPQGTILLLSSFAAY